MYWIINGSIGLVAPQYTKIKRDYARVTSTEKRPFAYSEPDDTGVGERRFSSHMYITTASAASASGVGAQDYLTQSLQLIELMSNPAIDAVYLDDQAYSGRYSGWYQLSGSVGEDMYGVVAVDLTFVEYGGVGRDSATVAWRLAIVPNGWGLAGETGMVVPQSVSNHGALWANPTGPEQTYSYYAPVEQPAVVSGATPLVWYTGCCRVFDTNNVVVPSGATWPAGWTQVFGPEHAYVGVPAVTNGLLLLLFQSDAVYVSLWNTSLGTPAWQEIGILYAANLGIASVRIVRLTTEQVVVELLQSAGGSAASAVVTLLRGRYTVLWNIATRDSNYYPALVYRRSVNGTPANIAIVGNDTVADDWVAGNNAGLTRQNSTTCWVAAYAQDLSNYIVGMYQAGYASGAAALPANIIYGAWGAEGIQEVLANTANAWQYAAFSVTPFDVSNFQTQAETAQLAGSWSVSIAVGGYSGTGYIVSPNTNTTDSANINFEPGTNINSASLYMRYLAGPNQGILYYTLTTNGAIQAQAHLDCYQPSQSWETVRLITDVFWGISSDQVQVTTTNTRNASSTNNQIMVDEVYIVPSQQSYILPGDLASNALMDGVVDLVLLDRTWGGTLPPTSRS